MRLPVAEKVDAVCVSMVACVPPLLLGGAPAWAVVVIAASCVVALAVSLSHDRKPLRVEAGDLAPFIAVSWTAVQLVPLPWQVVRGQLEVAYAYELAGLEGWSPLSMDPAGTREQLVVAIATFSAYALGRVVARRRGRRFVLTFATLSPFLVVLVGLGHELAGADRIFGIYEPRFANPSVMAPLLNSNHLGAFAALGAVLGLGVAMSARGRGERIGYAVGAAVCVGAVVATASRGALVGLVVGAVWALLVAARRRRGRGARDRWIVVGGSLATMVVAAAYVGVERLQSELANGDFSKIELAWAAMELTTIQPLVGVGRGAFEPVFSSVMGTGTRFTHPENIAAQWLVEWGVVLAPVIAVAVGRRLWRGLRSSDVLVSVAAGALVGLVVHDLADFALEMPGVSVVAALVLAAAGGGRTKERGRRGEGQTGRDGAGSTRVADERARWVGGRVQWLGTLTAAIVVLVLAPGVIADRPEAAIARLEALAGEDRADVERVLVDLVVDHPMDAGVALYAGYALHASEPTLAIRWLNRAMALAPGWASPHVLAAVVLHGMGARSQALLEIREAETRSPGSTSAVLCGIVGSFRAEAALRALPDGQARWQVADRVAACLSPAEAERLDDLLAGEGRAGPSVALRIARRAMARGDLSGALRVLDASLALSPHDEGTLEQRARVLRSLEGAAVALASLPPTTSSWTGRVLRAELAAEAGDEARLELELSRLRTLAAGRPSKLSDAWEVAGRIEERRGNLGSATRAFERALRLDPDSMSALEAVARVARRGGQTARARAAFVELCRRGHPNACTRVEATDP